jgi:hypothetical protein
MASRTSISNRGLSKLGQPRVSNVATTDTKAARVMNEMYDSVRDAVLAAYPWNFAGKRATLAPDADAPDWGWNYAYTMPSDFLALNSIKNNPDYEFEGGKILTNEGPVLYIKYTSQVTDEGSFSALFSEVFATRLSFEGCEEITQSNTKKATLGQEYKDHLEQAYQVDAKENPIEDEEDDDWVLARL